MNAKKLTKVALSLIVGGVVGVSGLLAPAHAQVPQDTLTTSSFSNPNALKVDANGKSIIGAVIGDSNTTTYAVETANWVRQINAKLDKHGNNYTFVNFARNGAMASDFEEEDSYIDPYLGETEIAQLQALEYVPNLVIFLGTNDALMEVPLVDFKSYYNTLIDKVLTLVKVDRLVLVTPSVMVPLSITKSDGSIVDVVSELSSKLSRQIKKHIINIKKDVNFVKIIKSHGMTKKQVRAMNIDYYGVREIWDHVHLDVQSHYKIARNIDDRLILK